MINEAHPPMCNTEPMTYLSSSPAIKPSMLLAWKEVENWDNERICCGTDSSAICRRIRVEIGVCCGSCLPQAVAIIPNPLSTRSECVPGHLCHLLFRADFVV